MTALLALLKIAWPYMLAAALGGAVAGWFTHKADSIELARQKAAFSGYQAKVADQAAAAEKAAREALQGQIDTAHKTDQRNEDIIRELNARASTAESDRDLARRLLNSARRPVASTPHQLPQAPDQPGTASAGRDPGLPSLETQVADTLGECSRNADRLNALIAQIKPQMEQ